MTDTPKTPEEPVKVRAKYKSALEHELEKIGTNKPGQFGLDTNGKYIAPPLKGKSRKNTPDYKAMKGLKSEARKYMMTAIMTLVEICQNSGSNSARVQAANSLLDRGFGKPATATPADVLAAGSNATPLINITFGDNQEKKSFGPHNLKAWRANQTIDAEPQDIKPEDDEPPILECDIEEGDDGEN